MTRFLLHRTKVSGSNSIITFFLQYLKRAFVNILSEPSYFHSHYSLQSAHRQHLSQGQAGSLWRSREWRRRRRRRRRHCTGHRARRFDRAEQCGGQECIVRCIFGLSKQWRYEIPDGLLFILTTSRFVLTVLFLSRQAAATAAAFLDFSDAARGHHPPNHRHTTARFTSFSSSVCGRYVWHSQ